MTLTIIVPTHDRADFLAQALQSLIAQRAGLSRPLDILVIDDGSTDGTADLLAGLGRAVRVVRQANAGVCRARNTGLDHLLPETEFVSFLDSDDISPPGRFAADLALLEAEPELDLTYGPLCMVREIDPATLAPPPGDPAVRLVVPQLSAAIFRRRLIDRIGRFDERFVQAEDTDYLLRVFEAGTTFREVETICAYYRRHPGNLTKRLEESRAHFLRALHGSMRRRRDDPSIRLVKPAFDVQPIAAIDFY